MRVLIVEDEFLVGVQLEQDIRSAGFTAVGPYSTLATATEASRRERFDLALLDVNLDGDPVFPLADGLLARGVPFIFLTGYLAKDLPDRFRATTLLVKPYNPAALIKAIRKSVPKPPKER